MQGILSRASLIRVVAQTATVLAFGYLGDVFSKRRLLVIVLALQGASFVIVPSTNISAFYVHTAIVSIYGLMPLVYAIRVDYFGLRAFTSITAATWVASYLLGMGANYLLIDGFYRIGIVVPVLICLIGAAVFYLAKPPQAPKRVHAA